MIKDLKNSIVRAGLVSVLSFGAISSGVAAPSASTDQLPQFLLNLGSYIGYDLNSYTGPTPPINTITMADGKSIKEVQNTAIELYLGTIVSEPIVDGQSPLNSKINKIFSEKSSASTFTSPLIDQVGSNGKPSSNPIDQSILNMLTTPDWSYCIMSMGDQSSSLWKKCASLFQGAIATKVLGGIPPTLDAFNALEPTILNQLNGNTLIDPLLYQHQTSSNTSGNSGTSASENPTGLPASNQEQKAEDFIRYVTGIVAVAPKTNASTYNSLYQDYNTYIKNYATQTLTTPEIEAGINAEQKLGTYIANLRVFAAQTSVGVSNLYYIFSKRMNQSPPSSTGPTSQALNEYTMATRRLYDPAAAKGSQWVDQINNASAATVQKEIAVLLSEINYQLYLTRQQQERLLLTNTVMLFQLGHLVEPTPIQAGPAAPQ